MQANKSKKIVLAFLNSKGLIYTNHVPRGALVNANYLVDVLGKFLQVFKQKRPAIVATMWRLHWNIAPVHTAAMVTDWMAARQIQVIQHLPSLLILPEPTSSCSPRVKRELAGLTLDSLGGGLSQGLQAVV